MKNKIIKLIGMIGIAGILCITGVPSFGYINNSQMVVYALSHYGCYDGSYSYFKENAAKEAFYKGSLDGQFSKPYVDQALKDGLVTQDQYNKIINQLKDVGYLTESEEQNVTSSSSVADTSKAQSSAADNAKSSASKSATSSSASASKTAAKAEIKIKSVEQTDATCTTPGSKTTYYTDGTKKTESIPATKHDYKLKDGKDATCTTAGYKTYTCSKCGDTYTDKTAALGHDYKLTETKAATCTAAGYKTYTCSRCGEVKKQMIPKTDHTPGDWTVKKQAGLFTTGQKQQTCKVCGAVLKTEIIPQTCPLPLAGVAGIAIGTAAVIAGAVILVRKMVKKSSKLNSVQE
jgi:hypothetical protein